MIDILIPSYKDDRIIRAINSIVNHMDSEKFRIIIQDGGSSEELIKSIKSNLRTSDILLTNKDKGIFDALNILLENSSSEWVGWIGSDDFIAPDFSVSYMEKCEENYDVMSFSTLMFDERTKLVKREYLPVGSKTLRKLGLHVPHFSTFIRRNVASSLRFDERFLNFADIFYFLKLENTCRFKIMRGVVSTYMAMGGASNSSLSQMLQTNLMILKLLSKEIGVVKSALFVILKIFYKLSQIRVINRYEIK